MKPQEQASLIELSEWQRQEATNKRHEAIILKILNKYTCGLTTQQIISHEKEFCGYQFLTDNRLRNLRKRGYIESYGPKPMHWRIKT